MPKVRQELIHNSDMKQREREGKNTNSVTSRVTMYKFQGLSENCSNFYTQVSTTNSVLFRGSPKNELTGAGFFLHICECYYIKLQTYQVSCLVPGIFCTKCYYARYPQKHLASYMTR